MNSSPCSVRTADFRGWPAAYLENGIIRLVAVPSIGGRLMAYDLGPYSYFFVDPDLAGKLYSAEENQGDGSLAAWKNYGGDKTWPAPQGWDNDQQWHGPPDPVLDTGRYTLDVLDERWRKGPGAHGEPSGCENRGTDYETVHDSTRLQPCYARFDIHQYFG